MTTKQVLIKAHSLGLKVLGYLPATEIEDGFIKLEKNYRIQVNEKNNILMLIEVKDSGYSYINTRTNKDVWEAAVKLINGPKFNTGDKVRSVKYNSPGTITKIQFRNILSKYCDFVKWDNGKYDWVLESEIEKI